MQRRILIIQGHPDADNKHFGHALAEAYASAALAAGHELRIVQVAALDFPLLRSKKEWEEGGMPALVYRWIFRAHSVKALERNILGFVGISPIHETLIGMVEGEDKARKRWLEGLRRLGAGAQ